MQDDGIFKQRFYGGKPVACLNVVHGFGLFCRTEKYNFGQIDVDGMVIDYIPLRIKQAGF